MRPNTHGRGFSHDPSRSTQSGTCHDLQASWSPSMLPMPLQSVVAMRADSPSVGRSADQTTDANKQRQCDGQPHPVPVAGQRTVELLPASRRMSAGAFGTPRAFMMRLCDVVAAYGLLTGLTAFGVDTSEPITSTGGAGGNANPGKAGAAGQAGSPGNAVAELADPIEYEGLDGWRTIPSSVTSLRRIPLPHAFDGRIYVYASHDLDSKTATTCVTITSFRRTISSTGKTTAWPSMQLTSRGRASSTPQTARTAKQTTSTISTSRPASSIWVAVSDSPAGPFVDRLGEPLITEHTGRRRRELGLRPFVFIDDDGQAYLYFGGGKPDTGDNARVSGSARIW